MRFDWNVSPIHIIDSLIQVCNMMYFLKIYLFYLFYFWLHWVFVAACGLSPVAASGG